MKRLLAFLLAVLTVLALCGFENQKPAEVLRVERLIAAIGEVSLERGKYVTDAEQAYAALYEADKELVENAGDLAAAREAYNALLGQEAEAVSSMISAIGKVTVDKEAEIVAAEEAYDALPEEAKPMVENYEELTDARFSLDILKQLFEAQERGQNTIEVDGVKISYVVDEEQWAVVTDELTEEYEPADLAYAKQTLSWTDMNHRVKTEVPTGWNREQRTNSYMVGFLYTNRDASMAMYLWSAHLTKDHMKNAEPYAILDATATELIGSSREHGEFHHTIYAQHRALWCRVDMDGSDTLFILMLVGDDVIVLQAWRPERSLTKQMLGITVHCLNHMTIGPIE